MKPKNSKEREMLDYNIPDYSTHPVNLDPNINTGRGIAVYTHNSIEKSAIQIKVEARFEEVCFLEIRLRGGDNMIFGCFYRSPTPSEKSKENNDNLNNLLRYISRKKYSHTLSTWGLQLPRYQLVSVSLLTTRIARKQNSLKQSEIDFFINILSSLGAGVEMTKHPR